MSDITSGYTFVNGEKNVTHIKLNSLVGNAVLNSSFIDSKTAAVPPSTASVVYSDGSGTLKRSLIGNLVTVSSLGTSSNGMSLLQGQTGNNWNLYRLKVDPNTLTLVQETNDLLLTVIAAGSPGTHTVQGEATAPGTGAIALATISNANIASATLTGSLIANATITGGLIASATITGSNIAAMTVTGGGTSGNIASGTISSYNLATAVEQTLRGYNSLDCGDMSVWQGPTAATTITSAGIRGADRWIGARSAGLTGSATQAQFQVNFLPSGTNAAFAVPNEFCTRIACTTAQASLAAGDFLIVNQTVTGNRAMPLWGYTTSVGLWVRSSMTGTFSVALRSSNVSASAVQTFTIGTAATWTYCTFPSFPAFPEGTTGTGWNHGNASYYALSICLASGSTFQAPSTNTWSANNYISASGQSNWLSSTSNTFDFMLVQHEPVIEPAGNNLTTPYNKKTWDQEYFQAQRYYQKSYAYAIAVGSANVGGFAIGNQFTGGPQFRTGIRLPVQMISAPTLTVYRYSTGVAGSYDLDNGQNLTVSGSVVTEKSLDSISSTANATSTSPGYFHYALDTGI